MLELIAQTAEDARAVVEDGAAVQALLCDIAAREAAAEAESAGQDARPPLEEVQTPCAPPCTTHARPKIMPCILPPRQPAGLIKSVHISGCILSNW